jgi:CYTH domain-containing protein
MAQEIDRTFLVQNDLQRQNASGFLVRQGFLFASLTFPL